MKFRMIYQKNITSSQNFILADTYTRLKSGSHLPDFFICLNESPFKMMKNAFYFIVIALFVLKILKFLI